MLPNFPHYQNWLTVNWCMSLALFSFHITMLMLKKGLMKGVKSKQFSVCVSCTRIAMS